MIAFVKARDPGSTLWSRTKDNFINDLCYLFVFKMITGDGFTKIEGEFQLEPGLRLGKETLRHNFEKIHPIIYDWAMSHVKLGCVAEWNEAAKLRQFPEEVKGINLWIDSSDFPLQCTEFTEEWYSKKLEGTGIRVQFVTDAATRILYVYGPVYPTQHDSHFLLMHKQTIKQLFKGGKIIGDNHYSSGGKQFVDPKFVCNSMESAIDQAIANKENLEIHSKRKRKAVEIDLSKVDGDGLQRSMQKLKENGAVSNSRGLIESVFGIMKQKFCMLSERCLHRPDELFEIVVIASAIHNLTIEKNSTI